MGRFARSAVWLSLLSAWIVGAHDRAGADVVFNEIHYHPNTVDGFEEFLELANTGTAPVDLQGWRISGGVDLTFTSPTLVAAGGLVVVAADPAALEAATGFAGALGPWAGRLSNGGERIALRNPAGIRVDDVTYSDSHQWPAEADGDGPSLELINPALPNQYPAVWRGSLAPFGTPGAVNSVFESEPGPVVFDTIHNPPVPNGGQSVTITTHVVGDAGPAPTVVLWHRRDGDPAFTQSPMTDDGAHGDGAPGDGVYGTTVPGLAAGQRLDFHIRAVNANDRLTTAPLDAPRTAYLCPFSNTPPPGNYPAYRIVMTAANQTELETRDLYSDVLLDATFIHEDGRIFYNVGIRYRGSSTRHQWPKAYRVSFAKNDSLDGVTELNLLSQEVIRQKIGYRVFQRSGFPTPLEEFHQVSFNGTAFLLYLQVERIDDDFLSRVIPAADQGNLYRGEKTGALDYRGTNPDSYRVGYEKKTNESEDDWTDLIDLCNAINNTPDNQFAAAMEARCDVDNWCRFFALHKVINNWEGGIYLAIGDDYYIYFRNTDGRSMYFPWDMDTILKGDQLSVWSTTTPAPMRFLRHNAFAPIFIAAVRDLLDNEFSVDVMNQEIDAIDVAWPALRQELKDFVVARHTFLRNEISWHLTLNDFGATTDCDGVPVYVSPNPNVALNGKIDQSRTFGVEVNGATASHVAWQGTWSHTVALQPGMNVLVVRATGRYGEEVERLETRVYYAPAILPQSDALAGNRTWSPASGIYRIDSDLTLEWGATLTVQEGTRIRFGPHGRILSSGSLYVEGSAASPVSIGPDDCATSGGQRIYMQGPLASVRLRHAHFRRCGIQILVGISTEIEDCQFEEMPSGPTLLAGGTGSFSILNSTFENGSGDAMVFASRSGTTIVENCRIAGMGGSGVMVDAGGGIVVRGTLIRGCGAGIQIYTNWQSTVDHCTVVDCAGPGIELQNGSYPSSAIAVHSSILWNNGEAVSAYPSSTLDLTWSDAGPGDGSVYPGTRNINRPPLFVDPASGDYHLAPGSPCIRTGAAFTDMGAFPYDGPLGLTGWVLK